MTAGDSRRSYGKALISAETLGARSVFHTRYESNCGERAHEGGAAVAEEGERDADNGSDADAHTGVNEHLEEEAGGNAGANQQAQDVAGAEADDEAADDDHAQ